MVGDLRDGEVGRIAALSLLDLHSLGESLPHAVLPLKVVFFHALIIVALAPLSDPDSTHLLQVVVNVLRDEVVVLVGLVTEAEDDEFKALELVLAIGEFEGFVREVLAELNGVVGGLALAVGSHDEEYTAVLGKLVEVLEIIFLRVADEGRQSELGLGLLRETNSVFLSRARL